MIGEVAINKDNNALTAKTDCCEKDSKFKSTLRKRTHRSSIRKCLEQILLPEESKVSQTTKTSNLKEHIFEAHSMTVRFRKPNACELCQRDLEKNLRRYVKKLATEKSLPNGQQTIKEKKSHSVASIKKITTTKRI